MPSHPESRAGFGPLGAANRCPQRLAAFFEPHFGYDFSAVRVHTGATADDLNRTLSARAFTTGQNIVFRQGEYTPDSHAGKELLAHELTHVIQQGVAVQSSVARCSAALEPDDSDAIRSARDDRSEDSSAG